MNTRTSRIAFVAPALFAAGAGATALPQAAHEFDSLPTLTDHALQEIDSFGDAQAMTIDLDFEGETYVIDLVPHSMRADDFNVIVHDEDGYRSVSASAPTTFRGEVRDAHGIPVEGLASAGRTPEGWNMILTLPDVEEYVLVQPVAELVSGADGSNWHAVYRSSQVVDDGVHRCGNDDEPSVTDPFQGPGQPGTSELAVGDPVLKIAFDTDVEFYNLNGQSIANTIADIENVMNSVEFIYERDPVVSFEVTTIVVRAFESVNDDPYTEFSPSAALSQFQGEWNNNFGGIQRHLTHFMTGKNLSGSVIGIAYLGVLCTLQSAYGLSQSRFTGNFNSRVALTAHELGHNLSAGHCEGCAGSCNIMCSFIAGCDGLGAPEFGPCGTQAIRGAVLNASCPVASVPEFITAPFFESFESDPLDKDLWTFNDKAVIVSGGKNEPSEPFSMKLNALNGEAYNQDDVRTGFMDLSGESGLHLSYFSEFRRMESGKEGVVEYSSSSTPGWTELERLTSNGVDQDVFEYRQITLPADAYHDRFRVRFRILGDEGDDSWYIDDVHVTDGPTLTQEQLTLGQISELKSYGAQPGEGVLFLYSFAGTGAGPCFFGGSVCLDILTPFSTLNTATADGSGVATALAFIPGGFSLIDIHTQAVVLRSPLADSVVSNAVSQTIVP